MAATRVINLTDAAEVSLLSDDDLSLDSMGSLSTSHSGFDRSSLPTQPLAVSKDLLFMAHSEGFYVYHKSLLVAGISKRFPSVVSNGGRFPWAPKNVSTGGSVSILSLSTDSQMLAACVCGCVYFYEVKQLRKLLPPTPSFSSSLNKQEEYVKDMRWTDEKEYVVLSTDAKLYQGVVGGSLQHVLDNVDAVDWSINEGSIAVARKNLLTILSRGFETILTMSMWSHNVPGAPSLKVDSIRWCRPECFILGCIQLAFDGTEEMYIVRTIYLDKGRFTDTFPRPVMLSFDEIFMTMKDEVIPSGRGPHLFLSCLKKCGFGIMAKKENDDHGIYLIRWSSDGSFPKIAVIHLDRNERTPLNPLQDNDNVLVGLCIDEDFMPYFGYGVIFGMTLDGKVIMLCLRRVSNTTAVETTGEPSSRKKIKLVSEIEQADHDDKRQAYIILMTDKHLPETIVTKEDKNNEKNKHLKLLESVLGSMDAAKDAMMYSYMYLNGMAAFLSESEAKRIAECPDVKSVVADQTMTLLATDSMASMNLESRNNSEDNITSGVWLVSEGSDEDYVQFPKKWKGCSGRHVQMQ